MKSVTFTNSTDHELLSRFAAGDRGALGELAKRHERSLLGLANGMLGQDSAAACDAVQSMWVRVIKYAKGFQGKSEVKTWMYRILINECRDLRRVREIPAEHAPLRLTSDDRAPMVASENVRTLQAALKTLGDDKREVLLLCYHAGMTHEVAAEVLEIPLGTLKSRLHAGLKELRVTLGETDEGEVVA